ncbi:WYL domain-containing protein [Bacteroides fragilis]|nr:WYL domain-containing protein [Bacteroides fragilis]
MGSNALSVSERKIEAVGIFFSRTNWYLIGFYLPKEIYLTFRIDRIQKCTFLMNYNHGSILLWKNSYASFTIKKIT